MTFPKFKNHGKARTLFFYLTKFFRNKCECQNYFETLNPTIR